MTCSTANTACREGDTYLSDLKTIVDLVLERTHLDLSDELWAEDSLFHGKRKELAHVWQDKLGLVVGGRVQRRQS